MNLYRATYQAPARTGAGLRRMTYAAQDDAGAERIALAWQVGYKLLKVQRDRALQPQQQFTLEA